MPIKTIDVVIIGSGPGGLAAAIAAKKKGAKSVLIIDRDKELGGILVQCIHNGFGVEIFKEDLPGPTYAKRFIDEVEQLAIETLLDTMVLDITPSKLITATNKQDGIIQIQARAIVLAMGCRERSRAQIQLPGSRPAGVYTAGTAQRWVNVEGFMPGKKFVILGSGDIGMIMARRLTFEGAKVDRVVEILPYISGLMRNYVQCLEDFDIPLKLQHTISRIIGNERVEAVETVQVDHQWNPIPGTEEIITCDTLLLSVGLIPENELSKKAHVMLDSITGGPVVNHQYQTSVEGIFAAGNVVHVYDLVDWVTEAGYIAGENASEYALSNWKAPTKSIRLATGENIRYVVPQIIHPQRISGETIKVQMRVSQPVEEAVWLEVSQDGNRISRKAFPYARPGEMLSIDLKTNLIDKIDINKEVSVSLYKRQ